MGASGRRNYAYIYDFCTDTGIGAGFFCTAADLTYWCYKYAADDGILSGL